LTRTIPKVFVTRFFQLVSTRQFTEAERILERIKQKMQMSEHNRGYFQALYGMLLAHRNNNDRYAFLPNLNPNDKKRLKAYRLEFLRQSEHRLHADYDRGFFSAWAYYMRILPKLESATAPVANKNHAEALEAEGTKTELKSEVGQSKTSEIGPQDVKTEMRVEAGVVETAEAEHMEKAQKSEPKQSTLSDFSE